MTDYDVGDVARLTATFRDAAAALADPDTVEFTARKPDGTDVSFTYNDDPELVRDSLGVFRVDLEIDQPGVWVYHWTSTGAAQGGEPGRFRVRAYLTAEVPTVDDVAALLRARTKDNDGNEAGTFNENTRPTGAQAKLLLSQAAGDVLGRTGQIPEPLYEFARQLIVIRAAVLIELAFFPEQSEGQGSPERELRALYDGSIGRLVDAVQLRSALSEDPLPADLLAAVSL